MEKKEPFNDFSDSNSIKKEILINALKYFNVIMFLSCKNKFRQGRKNVLSTYIKASRPRFS